jgi:hypothetical protein
MKSSNQAILFKMGESRLFAPRLCEAKSSNNGQFPNDKGFMLG